MIFKNEGTVKFQQGDQVFIWEPISIDTRPSRRDDYGRIVTIIMRPETQSPEPDTEGLLTITVGNFTTGETEAQVTEIGTVSKAKDAPVVCKIAYRKSV